MVSSGSGDPEYELDEIFSSGKEALAAANAKLKRVVKANKKFEFSTIGRPDFFAEHPIILQANKLIQRALRAAGATVIEDGIIGQK